MSRSLSWISQNDLDSLFADLDVTLQEQPAAPATPTAPTPQTATEDPFDRHARRMVEANARLSAMADTDQQRAASAEMPALLPISLTDPPLLVGACERWKTENELPLELGNLSYPTNIQALLEWLVQSSEAEGGFFADADGLPLASRNAKGTMISMSAAFRTTRELLSLGQEDEALQHILLPLPSGTVWHFGWLNSPYGQLAWGLCTAKQLTLDITNSITLIIEASLASSSAH